MMDSKRQLQIAELIKRNFSLILMKEGMYMYGGAMVSVTNVKMSPDLRLAKIYLSIFNTDDKESVMTEIQHHISLLKQQLVANIRKQVRFVPDIAIFNDELLDEMDRVDRLLGEL